MHLDYIVLVSVQTLLLPFSWTYSRNVLSNEFFSALIAAHYNQSTR